MTLIRKSAFLLFLLTYSGLAQGAPPVPFMTESTVGKLVRTERQTLLDYDACKLNLYGDSSTDTVSGSWSCEFGEAVWAVDTFFKDDYGIHKRYTVPFPGYHEGPDCNVILELSTNGYRLEARTDGTKITREQAVSCLDLAKSDPASGISSPVVELFDYPENVALPGPTYPGNGRLYYSDVKLGDAGTILDFSYQPLVADFKNAAKFQKGYSGCEAEVGCVSVSDGIATFEPTGGPSGTDLWFSTSELSTPPGKGCNTSFQWNMEKSQLSWDESVVRYFPLFPPPAPGKGEILKCAQELASGSALKPTLRMFRYAPPYTPLHP